MRVSNVSSRITNITAVNVTHRRIKVTLHLFKTNSPSKPGAAWITQTKAIRGVIANQPWRIGALVPDIGLQRVSSRQCIVQIAKVRSINAVITVGTGITFGDNKTNIGVIENIGRNTGNKQVGGINILRFILTDGQGTNIPATYPTADSTAVLNIHGLPGTAETNLSGKVRASVFSTGT